MTKYYTLFARYNDSNLWVIDFGSYDRSEVEYERKEFRAHGFRASNLKIVCTNDAQSDINEAWRFLNYGNN